MTRGSTSAPGPGRGDGPGAGGVAGDVAGGVAGDVAGVVDVEISIVNHANRALLGRCLASIPAATTGLRRAVTVIDNASHDDSLAMVARDFAEVAVIANDRRLGFGANHNQVIDRLVATGSARYVLVLNDDTALGAEAVTRMVASMDRDASLGAVGPVIRDPGGSVAMSRFAYPSVHSALLHDLGTRFTEMPDPAGWLQGCCLLVRVQALVGIGGFDPRFFLFYEDCDLSRRLVDAGWSLAVCPQATVVHVGHASVLRTDFVAVTPLQGQRSRFLYLDKHVGPRRARLASWLGRALLAGRAAAAGLRSVLPRGGSHRHRAVALAGLARLDPRRPLPHELTASTAAEVRAPTVGAEPS